MMKNKWRITLLLVYISFEIILIAVAIAKIEQWYWIVITCTGLAILLQYTIFTLIDEIVISNPTVQKPIIPDKEYIVDKPVNKPKNNDDYKITTRTYSDGTSIYILYYKNNFIGCNTDTLVINNMIARGVKSYYTES